MSAYIQAAATGTYPSTFHFNEETDWKNDSTVHLRFPVNTARRDLRNLDVKVLA